MMQAFYWWQFLSCLFFSVSLFLEHSMYQREFVGRGSWVGSYVLIWLYLPVMRRWACSYFTLILQSLTLWAFYWLLNSDLPPGELGRTAELSPFTYILPQPCLSCISTPTTSEHRPVESVTGHPSLCSPALRQAHLQFLWLITYNSVVEHWLADSRNSHYIPSAQHSARHRDGVHRYLLRK